MSRTAKEKLVVLTFPLNHEKLTHMQATLNILPPLLAKPKRTGYNG
jgi:hypothetical protein